MDPPSLPPPLTFVKAKGIRLPRSHRALAVAHFSNTEVVPTEESIQDHVKMAANLGLTGLPVSKVAWTDVVARKQTTRNEHIKKHLTDLVDSSHIARITNIKDVDSLTLLIEKGEISAEEVARAYIVK